MKKWRRCFSYRWSHFLCQNNERDLKPIKGVWVSYKKELVNMGVWGELMPSGFGEKNETQRGVRELGVRLCWTRGAQEVWSSEPDPSSGLKDQSWVGTQNLTPTSVKFWQESKSCKLTGRTVQTMREPRWRPAECRGAPGHDLQPASESSAHSFTEMAKGHPWAKAAQAATKELKSYSSRSEARKRLLTCWFT